MTGSRGAAALRFAASIGAAAALTGLLIWLQPRRLSVVTDIVGYPIHANFNYARYLARYWLIVLFAPALATVIYHVIGFRWPGSHWPRKEPVATAEANEPTSPSLLDQFLRALAVGATLGLATALFDPRGTARFWTDVLGVALIYTIGLFGIAALVGRRREASASVFALLNASCTSLAVALPYAASQATRMVVTSDRSIHPYPWFPGWAAVATAILLLALMVARLAQAPSVARIRRIEGQGLLLVVAPIVMYVCTASLLPPLGGFDSFHLGEFLAGARLFHEGAFPWRDMYFIHGLLQDVLLALAGFRFFGESGWGGFSGYSMFGVPLWWITNYLLLVYLFRHNRLLLGAAFAVGILGLYSYPYPRFAPLPLILLALAALLERASIPRAFLLSFTLVLSNVLVPEMAYAIPACSAVLVGFEGSHYRRDLSFFQNLRGTIFTALTGLGIAALWFAFLARHNAARAFLGYYATFAPGHALTGAIPHERGTEFFVYMFLPPTLLLLGFWYWVASVRMKRALAVGDWVMMALALVTLLYYPKALIRADMPHVVQGMAPALLLLCYLIDKGIPLSGLRSQSGRLLGIGVVLAGPLCLLALGAGQVRALPGLVTQFTRVTTQQPVLQSLGWSTPEMAPTMEAWSDVGRFLDATLDPGAGLFDFTNQPGLYYFLLRRKPASRYYHVSMAIRRNTQLDLVDELKRTRPTLVVFDNETGGLPAWDGISNEVRHYEVSRYLLRHYRPFARLHGNLFYLRNDLNLSVQPPAEPLGTSAAYSLGRACDWGYAPAFLRTDALVTGASALRRGTLATQRLTVSGWAADAASRFPANEVVVLAHGAVVARATPSLRRPDVAAYMHAQGVEGFGFDISQEWADSSPLQRSDLQILGISLDSRASALRTPWQPAKAPPAFVRRAGGAPIALRPGAIMGFVDGGDLQPGNVTTFELQGSQLEKESGIELEIDATADATISLSDSVGNAGSRGSQSSVSFRVFSGSSNVRVMLGNCPQWYGLHGRELYLHHGPGVVVRALRTLSTP